jgi:hypothetical protein
MYGYWSFNDLTSECRHCKLQTHFLVREDAIGKRKSNCQSKKEEKYSYKSGHGPQREARYQDELVDCLSAARRTHLLQLQLVNLAVVMCTTVQVTRLQ